MRHATPDVCVCLEPRARRAGAIDVLPLTEFLTRLWSGAVTVKARSAQEDDRIISYIRNNPVSAGLAKRPEDWRWRR